MAYYCAYKDCEEIKRTFSKKSFFQLPTDERRDIWIRNSGNSSDVTSRLYICEDHFDPKYIRRQFNRALLHRAAIPYAHYDNMHFVEILESDALGGTDSDDIDSSDYSTSNSTIAVASPKLFRLKTLPKLKSSQNPKNNALRIPNANSSQPPNETAHNSSDNRNADDNEEVGVIFIETNDSSDELEAIEKPAIQLNNCHTVPKQGSTSNIAKIQVKRKYVVEEEPLEPSQSNCKQTKTAMIADETSPSEISAFGLNSLVTSSDTSGASGNEEMYFALSLVGILKRLPPQKRAKAKCHILTYLTELEYGTSSN